MAQPRKEPLGVGDRELEVLGRDAVGDVARLGEVAHEDQRAARGKRRFDDRAPRHRGKQPAHRLRHRVDEPGLRRDEDRLRHLVVLGLREKVHRDPVGVRARIGDDEHLRRAGDHVDADAPEDAPLRRGDISVPRAHDLVDRGHGRGAESERGDRLRAADAQDPVDARERRRRQHRSVQGAIGRRRHHHELAHARGFRGDGAHEHRRGIGRLAPGHVESHAIDRGHLLAEHRAVFFLDAPRRLPLPLVIAADALGRGLQRLALGARQCRGRALRLVERHLERRGRGGLPAIEPRGELEERRVAARAHVVEDRRGRALDRVVLRRLERDEARERLLETALGAREPPRLSHGSLRAAAR